MADSSTILLVDDEEAVRKVLTFPLERDGERMSAGIRVRHQRACRSLAAGPCNLSRLAVPCPQGEFAVASVQAAHRECGQAASPGPRPLMTRAATLASLSIVRHCPPQS